MRRTWRLLILAALMAVPLTGCERRQTDDGIPTVPDGVGGNAAEGGSPTPATTADVIAAMGEWAQCMRKQGFDVPDPYLDPEGGKLTFGYEGPVIQDVLDAYPDRTIIRTFDVAETASGHDRAALIDKFGNVGKSGTSDAKPAGTARAHD